MIKQCGKSIRSISLEHLYIGRTMSKLRINILSWFLLLIVFSVLREYLPSPVQCQLLEVISSEISAILDLMMHILNFISGHSDIPFLTLLNTVIDNRKKHHSTYSWVGWLYVLLYLASVGIVYHDSVDLEDFLYRIKNYNLSTQTLIDKGSEKMPDERKPNKGVQEVSSSRNSAICWSCLQADISLLRCDGCHKARYCGKGCQEDDWWRHGDWCRERGGRRKQKKKEKKIIGKSNGYSESMSEVD